MMEDEERGAMQRPILAQARRGWDEGENPEVQGGGTPGQALERTQNVP